MLETNANAGGTLVPVPFPETGDLLFAQASGSADELVALRPICEALGLAWSGQLERVRRHTVMSRSVRVTRTETADGPRDAVCLPLDMIPGFLFGIDVSRCKPEARPKVEAFQTHCFRVLRDHFRPHRAGQPLPGMDRPAADPGPGETLLDDGDDVDGASPQALSLWLSMVREARILNGRAAAREMWDRSPLPSLPRQQAPSAAIVDEIGVFLADRCVRGKGCAVTAAVLYRAYCAWARDTHQHTILSAVSFGKAVTASRWVSVERRKSNGNVIYQGLGLHEDGCESARQ